MYPTEWRRYRGKLAINPKQYIYPVNLNLPVEIVSIILPFAALFSKPVWNHAQILLVGAILATGKRTITSVLAVMGLSEEKHFQNYHRVLNRAVWSGLEASRVLLMILVKMFAPSEPIIIGIDDTIERRKGKKIKAKGIYRDPVRSSHAHFVKVSGLRWLSMMLLVEIPWAQRVWALPFLTVLAPSERYNKQHKRRHKKLIDWARQMMLLVKRWLPRRELVIVADSSFAALELLAHHLQANFSWKMRQTIWYSKPLPTFSDALALVRRFFWASTFSISPESTEMIKVPRPLFERLRDIAVYAA